MRVSMAYFDVLRATDLLDTNIQEEEAALRSLEQTQQREEVGLVAITDVYDAQEQLALLLFYHEEKINLYLFHLA